MSVYDRSRQIIRLSLRRDGVFIVVFRYIEERGLRWTPVLDSMRCTIGVSFDMLRWASVLDSMRCTVGVLFDICEFLLLDC